MLLSCSSLNLILKASEQTLIPDRACHVLMLQPCDLLIECKSRVRFFLCYLQLSILVLADRCDPNLAAKRAKDIIIRLIHSSLKAPDFFFEFVLSRLGLGKWLAGQNEFNVVSLTFFSSGSSFSNSSWMCLSSFLASSTLVRADA